MRLLHRREILSATFPKYLLIICGFIQKTGFWIKPVFCREVRSLVEDRVWDICNL
ncbi:MAG UNVERIFIED_CONTAM: hypothetical protein LVR29_20715 [Microcystis novacekii LVE1205-3]